MPSQARETSTTPHVRFGNVVRVGNVMELAAHDIVQTRVCGTASCVGDVTDFEHGLCSVCSRRSAIADHEMTFQLFRDRGRQWVRALHLPTRTHTRWREIREWHESIREELLAELRGVTQGSA